MPQPKAIVAQLGSRMYYAVPRIFSQERSLERLYTDICATQGWPRLFKLTPNFLRSKSIKKLLDRTPEGVPSDLITTFTSFGLEYIYRQRKARSTSEVTAVHLWAGDRFNDLIIQNGFGTASLVYGYNSASERIFAAAKKQGLHTVLEQTIAPKLVEMQILQEEAERIAQWKCHTQDDNADIFASREKREWDLADTIVCGSEFVRQNVIREGGSANKCFVVPYGINFNNLQHHSLKIRKYSVNQPLKVLFVGTIGLRKGIYYLIEAMRQLEKAPIQCHIIGNFNIDINEVLRNKPSNLFFCGPIPRSEIISAYSQADIFCLPSLCEGSATVIYEALTLGLPVITTPNSGSIVQDGVDGFIVPIRNSLAIAEKLELFVTNSCLLEQMSLAALEKSKYGSFNAYSERLLQVLSQNTKFY